MYTLIVKTKERQKSLTVFCFTNKKTSQIYSERRPENEFEFENVT